MNKKGPNIPASIRAQLLDLARKTNEPFQFVLERYALDRLLYRLSLSHHAEAFVVKGATLFTLWEKEPHRGTRDLDLLGTGTAEEARLKSLFEEVIATPVTPEDGLVFDQQAQASRIREDELYEGIRIILGAHLENAAIRLQIDIGFGDAVEPKPAMAEFPAWLDLPAAKLSVYPKETVIAEKFEAMVSLGIANTRMKDFFDIWVLAQDFPFSGSVLAKAIRATFERRKTDLPKDLPVALTKAFYEDPTKTGHWKGFAGRGHLRREPPNFPDLGEALRTFLVPLLEVARNDGAESTWSWPAGGPWGSPEI